MKKTIIRYFIYTMFIAIPLAMFSCYPGGLEYYSDSDIVVTNYDEGFNFSQNKLYFMPDTIHYLDDDADRSDEAAIVSLIATNMNDAGYTRLKDASVPDSVLVDSANVVLLTIVTSTTYSGGGWWGGCYPYWGWGCGYYPGYPWYGGGYYTYSYSTGTLIMEMAYEDGIDHNDETIPIVWDAKINGLLSGNTANMDTRITNTINQAFVQSPYLSQ